MGIIISIIGLGVVIFVHELGHMLAAKKSGIGVYEFSIGMGPKIWSFQKNETLYSLRILPFGGFVKLAGLDDDEKNKAPEHKRFQNKPFFNRAMTIAAGSLVNIFFGFVVFFFLFWLVGMPAYDSVVLGVLDNSPAYKAGLQKGDQLIAINGRKVKDPKIDVVQRIHFSNGEALQVDFLRNNERRSLQLSAERSQNQPDLWLIGIQLKTSLKRYPFLGAIYQGVKQTGNTISQVFISLKMLVSRKVSVKSMFGPVGIIQLTSSQFDKGAYNLLNILALINVSLGVVNLFPFPVLDGGHLLFLGIESIRRKPLNRKLELIINNIGAAILITLMVLIVFNDIINWKDRIQLLN